MFKIKLPSKLIQVLSVEWSSVKCIRELVLTLPYWKVSSDISKINACLEIEESLDQIDNEHVIIITKEAWTFLKDAMQLTGMNPLPDPSINRLYMLTYKSVLIATEE